MDQATQTVLKLNIEMERCYSDFIIEQELPYTLNEKLIVIPEFLSLEDEHHFELNNHIAIIDSKTGEIKGKYFDRSCNQRLDIRCCKINQYCFGYDLL